MLPITPTLAGGATICGGTIAGRRDEVLPCKFTGTVATSPARGRFFARAAGPAKLPSADCLRTCLSEAPSTLPCILGKLLGVTTIELPLPALLRNGSPALTGTVPTTVAYTRKSAMLFRAQSIASASQRFQDARANREDRKPLRALAPGFIHFS